MDLTERLEAGAGAASRASREGAVARDTRGTAGAMETNTVNRTHEKRPPLGCGIFCVSIPVFALRYAKYTQRHGFLPTRGGGTGGDRRSRTWVSIIC